MSRDSDPVAVQRTTGFFKQCLFQAELRLGAGAWEGKTSKDFHVSTCLPLLTLGILTADSLQGFIHTLSLKINNP